MSKNPDIAAKFGIEGYAEFKKSLDESTRKLKTLGTEMKAVTSAFDKNDKSQANLTAQNKVLTKQIAEQKIYLEKLKTGLAEVTAKYGENSEITHKYQQDINKATAALNTMQRQLEQNNKDLKDTSSETSKASDHTGKFASAAKAAAATITAAFTAVAAGVAAATKKLVSATKEVAEQGDEIDKNSQKVGMSAEAYQKWGYVFERNGYDIAQFKSGMKTLTNQIDAARNGNKSAVEQFQKLGISLDDLKNKSREDLLGMTVSGLQNVTDETTKAAMANDLFGKSGSELMPLLNSTNEATQQLLDTTEQYGMIMSDETVKASADFQDSLTTLKSTISGVKAKFLGEFLPSMTKITEGFSMLISGQDGASDKLKEGAKEIVGTFKKIAPQLISVINGIAGTILEIAPSILTALVQGIVENLPTLVNAAVSMLNALMRGLLGNIDIIMQAAIDLLLQLVNMICANLDKVVQAATQIIVTLATALAESAPELIPAMVEAIVTCVTTLIDNLDLIIDAGLQLIMGLAEGIIAAIPALIDRLPEIIEKIVKFFYSNMPKIIATGIELNAKLAVGLIKAIPQLVSKLPEIVMAIVKGIGEAIPQMLELGKNLIKGLWEGIKSVRDWIWDKISGFFSGIVDGIKDFFGIHSPSKLFENEIGKNMGLGVGVGFVKIMKSVKAAMIKAMPTSADLSIGVGGAPGVSVVNYNTFNSATERDAATFLRITNRSLGMLYGGAI